jgi:hypothetical protein
VSGGPSIKKCKKRKMYEEEALIARNLLFRVVSLRSIEEIGKGERGA